MPHVYKTFAYKYLAHNSPRTLAGIVLSKNLDMFPYDQFEETLLVKRSYLKWPM